MFLLPACSCPRLRASNQERNSVSPLVLLDAWTHNLLSTWTRRVWGEVPSSRFKTILVAMCCMLVLLCNSSPANWQSSSDLEARDWDRDSLRMQLCTVNFFLSTTTTHVFRETTIQEFFLSLWTSNILYCFVQKFLRIKWITVFIFVFSIEVVWFSEIDIARPIKTLVQYVLSSLDWSSSGETAPWRLVDLSMYTRIHPVPVVNQQ
jgi:hypothetical protein